VAVIETPPLTAEETGDGKEEDVPPPPHAATSRLKTTKVASLALKTENFRYAGNTFGLLRKIILGLLAQLRYS
jgi:hypothetical protein